MRQGRTLEASRCSSTPHESYSVSWHIASLFVVLWSSLLGTVLPILGKRVERFRVPDYVYAIGKSVATGVILGVALIHMLEPATESLTSDCLPDQLRNPSNPLSYLICLAAIAAMHSLEVCVRVLVAMRDMHSSMRHEEGEVEPLLSSSEDGYQHTHRPTHVHGHHHLIPAIDFDDPGKGSYGAQILSAVLLEFGVSLHSTFVGLAVGVSSDAELFTLVCALCFHQFFEGVALGARLVEAALTARTEYVFSAVFVLSAPVGAAVGIIILSENLINPKGASYLLTQGILDSICAGILLYLGFQLLVTDFYAALRDQLPKVRSAPCFVMAMLGGLWTGLVIMALIGQYL